MTFHSTPLMLFCREVSVLSQQMCPRSNYRCIELFKNLRVVLLLRRISCSTRGKYDNIRRKGDMSSLQNDKKKTALVKEKPPKRRTCRPTWVLFYSFGDFLCRQRIRLSFSMTRTFVVFSPLPDCFIHEWRGCSPYWRGEKEIREEERKGGRR